MCRSESARRPSGGVLFFDDSTDLATFTVFSVIFADGFESGDTSAW